MPIIRRDFLLTAAASAVSSELALAQARLEPLAIITQSGKTHRFQVEVARTDIDRARGLMFRRHLPADRGMIFDFERDEEVSMWMRNTFISLDMIFIRSDGIIHRIAARAEPLSERTISSGGPVRAVLELNGGICQSLGIAVGDRVEHEIFKRS